jgi:site-specific recombinase XerD
LRRFLDRSKTDATAEGLRALTPQSIEKYLVEDRGADGRRAPRHLRSALRMFFRFCHAHGYTSQRLDLAVPPTRSYRLAQAPRGLTDEQARQVLASVDRSTPGGRRDYAILQMLHTYGVRGGQVRHLRLADIDWRANTLCFKAVKGGNPSRLPLTDAVGESLLEYLRRGRPASSHPEVFLRLLWPFAPIGSTSGFSALVARRVRAAGLAGRWRGHAFRHAFATRLLACGQSLKTIADLVGHRSLSSTLVYTKVDFDALREAALDWPEVTP